MHVTSGGRVYNGLIDEQWRTGKRRAWFAGHDKSYNTPIKLCQQILTISINPINKEQNTRNIITTTAKRPVYKPLNEPFFGEGGGRK